MAPMQQATEQERHGPYATGHAIVPVQETSSGPLIPCNLFCTTLLHNARMRPSFSRDAPDTTYTDTSTHA
jgi:hypothetical protein